MGLPVKRNSKGCVFCYGAYFFIIFPQINLMCLVESALYKRIEIMNWNEIKVILGQVALVATGVLVANQVQKMLDKVKVTLPAQT
jgi:hypothetical protein